MTRIKKVTIRKHLFIVPLVGVIIATIFQLTIGFEGNRELLKHILNTIVITSGLWVGVTSIVFYLWNKYPWERYPAKHLVIEIAAVLIYTNSFTLGLYYFEVWMGIFEPIDNIPEELLINNLITFLITSIHEAAGFYRQWVANFSKSVKLEKDNIEAKYETLKSQINPHFLFNSLNSLTTVVHDNEKAVDYIQNLSEFLRYTLKTRNVELAFLKDELDILKRYLKLQKSRFGDNLSIFIQIPGKYHHFSLPPLVLQMLVENCIKHNIISKEKPLSISITSHEEHIIIENKLQKKLNSDSTEHGLTNIVERYKFFTEKEVLIEESLSNFRVTIPLLIVEQ